MNQPTLEEFEIQAEDIKRAETAKKLLIAISLICMVAGLVYGGSYKGSPVWLVLLVMPPYGPFIIYFSLKALLFVHRNNSKMPPVLLRFCLGRSWKTALRAASSTR